MGTLPNTVFQRRNMADNREQLVDDLESDA